MTAGITVKNNSATDKELVEHLQRCQEDFVPPLGCRVEVCAYARKLVNSATRFEAWAGNELVGLVAVYCNDEMRRTAYITNVSVVHEWSRKGVAMYLMTRCIEHVRNMRFKRMELEVSNANHKALSLYRKCGFKEREQRDGQTTSSMFLTISDKV
jgi:ribosomal protein S18 acetylase RimI-like enzyme